MRAANLGEDFDETIPESVRLSGDEIESMYRLLAIAKYEERYVIPSGAGSHAHRLDALATGCSLDGDGGPGMTAFDAMADKFHLTNGNGSANGEANGTGNGKSRRVNLLNWDGRSTDGLVPTK
jgi:nitrate reductase beta subunit